MKNKKFKILLYHGVTNQIKKKGIENFSGKHISKLTFLKQMKILKKNYNIISIKDLEKFKKQKFIPKNSVLITFDDGFENNYKVAFPILKKLKIPAVFYISTGLIGKKKLFWVDQIEDLINRSNKKQINLKLKYKKKYSIKTPNQKIKVITEIKRFCKMVSSLKKDRIIEKLKKETNLKPSSNSSQNYKLMNWQQVRAIDSEDLFEIGGHSTDHNILSKLPKKKMKSDIKNSINILEKKLKRKIKHYSYPEGQYSDYNKQIKSYLKFLGIKFCPSAVNGIANIDDDNFEFKRIMVGINKKKFPFRNFDNENF